jgi:hypothetical protein
MTKKTRALGLAPTLTAIAKKDRNYYRNLDDQQKKEFSAFVQQKYISNVTGSWMDQVCFIAFTNNNVNKNLFLLSKHPELQWLTLTTVSPTSQKRDFRFISLGGGATKSRKLKILEAIYPERKLSDLELLAEINSDDDIQDLAEQYHLEIK